jgi:hypothetical protein
MRTIKTKFINASKIVILIASLAVGSCSKNENPAPNTVTSTFTTALNGTYNGNGTDLSNVPFEGNVKVEVTSSTTARLSGDGGNLSISSIAVSSNGGYTGKTDSGADIAFWRR